MSTPTLAASELYRKLHWMDALRTSLSSLKDQHSPIRIAVVGVGQELNGDDIAGLTVIRHLKSHLAPSAQLLMIEAGPAPESYVGPICRFKPDGVILVDAAEMQSAPGSIQCLAWQDIDGLEASTHTMPLSLFVTYLTHQITCQVLLIGIQPATTWLGAHPSAVVQTATETAAQALIALLTEALT